MLAEFNSLLESEAKASRDRDPKALRRVVVGALKPADESQNTKCLGKKILFGRNKVTPMFFRPNSFKSGLT